MDDASTESVHRLRNDLTSEVVDIRYRAVSFITRNGGPGGGGGAMHGVTYAWHPADLVEYRMRVERWLAGRGAGAEDYVDFCTRWSPSYPP